LGEGSKSAMASSSKTSAFLEGYLELIATKKHWSNTHRDWNEWKCIDIENIITRKLRHSFYTKKQWLLVVKFGILIFICNSDFKWSLQLKLRCDERFTHAFTACGCIFKEITLVDSNQGNYFENATACSKRMLKTLVATQL